VITCSGCKKSIDPTINGIHEEKLCLDCIQDEYSSIPTLDFRPKNGAPKKEEKSNIKLEIQYAKLDYKYYLEIVATPLVDIKKGDPIQIGLSRQQLETFIEEMKVLRKRDKKK